MTAPTVPAPAATAGAEPRPPRFRFLRRLTPSAAVLAITTLALLWCFRPWRLDFTAPLTYTGDGLQHMMYTKGFLENGWYLHNPSLGAPGEMDLREFPGADTLPGLIIKFLGLFTRNPALINNLLFLLSFPLTSLGAYGACRGMRISVGPAVLAGVLYAFLPYHFWRGTGHLYLACYFVVAPAILAAWWVATGRLLDRADGGGRGRAVLAAAICAVASTSGLYYPFFAGLILGVASLAALCTRRDWRHFAAGLGLACLVAAGMLLCLLPTLRYLHRHPHPAVSVRAAGESEFFGLKIAQLVLPPESHPLHLFRDWKRFYNVQTPLVNENTSASLGVLGAAGCLGLLGWLLFRPLVRVPADPAAAPAAPPRLRETLDVLGVFNGAAVLYGTVGGVGMLFALFVSPQLRSLNRLSVFVGFFSLAAAAACVDRWCVRPGRPWTVRAAGWTGLGLLLALCLLDQMPGRLDFGSYRQTAADYRADRDFFRQVQAAVPPGTMIFQLPYVAFPESSEIPGTMGSDSHFRGYLHTRGLRWSYGAVKNSAADRWQQRVASLPLPEGVRSLALAGFGGVFLERAGYADGGAAVEAILRRLLGPPVAARPARLFFSMAEYNRALRASLTGDQWQKASESVRNMVFVRFGAGFTGPESKDGHGWYWCGPEGEITITNGGDAPRRVRLSLSAQTGRNAPARLTMSGLGVNQTWPIDRTLRPLAIEMEVPPGEQTVRFTCDGLPIDAPADARVMVWSPADFQLEELDAAPPPAAPESAGQSR